MKGKGRLFLILGGMAIFVFLFSKCIEGPKKMKATETTIAGAQTCKTCHAKIYENYLHDYHAVTSRPIVNNDLVNGPLPDSVYNFNEHLKIIVEKRKDGMYQVAYIDGKETIARKFDMAIGSGKDAYTYGSWSGDFLHQLPLSYFRAINSWANSPGFPAQRIYFSRRVNVRCLECHSSYIESSKVQNGPLVMEEKMKKKSLIYGIDCERCHGPAGRHVEFHINNPEEKKPQYIALYKTLTRKQKIDACGICHSGNDLEFLKPIFSFKPGDSISDYYGNNTGTLVEKEPDVHGNQVQMLGRSKCFIKSNDMSCNTCHNPHESKAEGLTLYSKKCMSCHVTIKHSEKTLGNAMVKTNCINCHMPLQTSKVISFQQAGHADLSPYKLHTHRIAVYN